MHLDVRLFDFAVSAVPTYSANTALGITGFCR
jgi:hypothetical protein